MRFARGSHEPDELDRWLAQRLAELAAEEPGEGDSKPPVGEFTADVVRRLRLRHQPTREADPGAWRFTRAARARATGSGKLRPALWLTAALAAALAAGVVWQQVREIPDSARETSQMAAARSASAVSQRAAIASATADDYARLSAELGSLGRQLEDLRRLRDAAGPTVELAAQDGLQIVVPLHEVLDLAETPEGSAGLRRVRW